MNTILTLPARPLMIAVCAIGWSMPIVNPANGSPQQAIIQGYASEAKSMDKNFKAFSPDRGQVLFSAHPATGKADTPSCTTCHTTNPANTGRTRAGKEIAPLALSKTPGRYSEPKKVEKWFRRNCKSVLGRVCTPVEKGDFLTFMINQ